MSGDDRNYPEPPADPMDLLQCESCQRSPRGKGYGGILW